MCGIAGIWNANHADDAPARIARMLSAMHHRGPDGRGMLRYAGGAAGMVRLALVDLTDRGQQPLWSDDRQVAILFNGEIYNFREERKRLEDLGWKFTTQTDTEVVLKLYLQHGTSFVDRLRGMYAIALYDWRELGPQSAPTLTLIRGPFGIKPLYVANPQDTPGSIVFASEIRALLASGLIERTVDPIALAEYLSCGFVWQPRTMIRGIAMLDPATIHIYRPGKSPEVRRFWHVPDYRPLNESFEESAERLRATLDESIRLHAFADAPVGAFLSGGVDSTGIVGLMREHVPNLQTYTLRFPDFPGADETSEAAETARFLGVNNTVCNVTGEDVARHLPQFAGQLDQPSFDGLNTWLVSQFAAKDVKGVLSGLGGDEWFAGYPVTRRMSRYSRTLLGQLQRQGGYLAALLLRVGARNQARSKLHSLSTRRSNVLAWSYAHTIFSWEYVRRLQQLGSSDFSELEHYNEILGQLSPNWQQESPVGLSHLLDSRVYMVNQLLRDSDATSMAHSLELRVPFVDRQVAVFSRTCLDEYKLPADGGKGSHYGMAGIKRVLIHALRDVLPPSLVQRRKQGFTIPQAGWLETTLANLVTETCRPEVLAARGLVNPKILDPAKLDFESHAYAKWYPLVWTLLILELWCREVLDESQPSSMNSDDAWHPNAVATAGFSSAP